MHFMEIVKNNSFKRMNILYMCNLCVIWQHHPYDMYIHLHTMGLIVATE